MRSLLPAALWLAAWLAACLLPAVPASAHTGGSTGYAEVTVQGGTVRYGLSLTLDALAGAADAGLAADLDRLAATVAAKVSVAADGRACAPVPSAAVPAAPDRATVQVVVLFACGGPAGEIAIRDDMADVLGPGHHTLATIAWDGGREQRVFEAGGRQARVFLGEPTAPAAGDAPAGDSPASAPPAGDAPGGFAAYLGLGVEHILLGFDHVLFVVALVLQGGRLASLLAIVTAFTLAHSITLALSVLDIAALPGPVVEPVIALSIAYVAAENIVLRDRAVSRRWAVGFLFGLVHGFGFAGALREVGLPADGLAAALLGFNLGVEAGQALIVAALLPALLWFRRFRWHGRLVQVASAAILAAGLLLLIERVYPGGA